MILLDTHVVVFLALEPHRLSKAAARAIKKAEAKDAIAIASITLWEIAMLVDRRSLIVSGSTEAFLKDVSGHPGLTTLELSPEIATLSTQFPPDFPKDPADRIIAATARAHRLALVTNDMNMQASPLLRTIW